MGTAIDRATHALANAEAMLAAVTARRDDAARREKWDALKLISVDVGRARAEVQAKKEALLALEKRSDGRVRRD